VSGPSRRDLFRGLFGRTKPKPPLVAYLPSPPAGEGPGVRGLGSQHTPHPNPLPQGEREQVRRFGRGVPLPVLRPPGAIEESAFLAACTRCNACIEACPHDAITLASSRLRGAAGTPVLNPADAPCRMCDDRPCIAVCEPLALRFDVPAKMGTAVISPLNCLAHRNSPCSVCVEQCPVEGAIRWENSRPTVNPSTCTGCGVCQYVCPAPQNAVMILPEKSRPEAPPRDPD